MTIKTVEINITGIVQGVGFRPFLFNLAKQNNLKGYILNRGNAGVRLVLQGKNSEINNFVEEIKEKKPKISFIETITQKEIYIDSYFNNLKIEKSEQGRGVSLTLPPDIAICDECLEDMKNSNLLKYYKYPFIACAVCGPRFTTVIELPYDRERSTMVKFPFCTHAQPISCLQEYSDFNNRRFHAQTFACTVCGPTYKLYNKQGVIIQDNSLDNILSETAKRINEGEIIAVKGIGGVHLVCLADNDDIIYKLRIKKGERKYKPFALMIPNLDSIKEILKVSPKEHELLTSFRRPIVLLERTKKNDDSIISEQVAPGLNNIGVMLPYSGIHYLLFDYLGDKPIIYTSGNKSYIPMALDNKKIFKQLQDLADVFLLHNRPIYQRADDSVLRVHNNKPKLIRRSRGYVPEYIVLPFKVKISGAIATGPLLATTGSILRRNRIFPTQHIGNVSHLETYEFLKNAIFHMKSLLQIADSEIEFIACDAHPEFITTKLAKEFSNQFKCNVYNIQHHYAHALSLMAENNVEMDEKIICITTDGVGYGEDGNIWGGEILLSSYYDYKRLGHLKYQPMVGGDRCTKFPARMAASIILNALGKEESEQIFRRIGLKKDLEYKDTEMQVLISQFEQANNHFPSENIPLSSSTGRIFDSVAYLLGVSNIKTYRGEPAMRLEGFATRGNHKGIDLEIKYQEENGKYIIDTSNLILDILSLLEEKEKSKEDIALKFQIELAGTFAELATKLAKSYGIRKIGITGGVAYNYIFSNTIKKRVNEGGYIFLEHEIIPPGDAGISTGQLIGGLFKFLREN